MADLDPQRARVLTLGPALVTILAVASFSPLATLAAVIWPLRPDEVPWRFQALSLFLGLAPQVAIGIAVIATFGLFGEMRRAIKGAAIAAIVLAGVLIVLLPVFVMDFLQLRTTQQQSRLPGFNRAAVETALIAAALVPILVWAGWRGLTVGKKPDVPGNIVGGGLVVAQDHMPVTGGTEQP